MNSNFYPSVGDRVSHGEIGDAIVMRVNKKTLTVAPESGGERQRRKIESFTLVSPAPPGETPSTPESSTPSVKAADSHLLARANTDEGRAARRERLALEGKLAEHQVSINASPFDKMLIERAAAAAEGTPAWASPDPLGDGKKLVEEPGKRYRYLSEGSINKRGLRGWVPVMKDGKPVKVADLALSYMPEDVARQRDLHYSNLAKQRMQSASDKSDEKRDRIDHAAQTHDAGFVIPGGDGMSSEKGQLLRRDAV